MKINLSVPKRVPKVKLPPVNLNSSYKPPLDFAAEEWLNSLNKLNLEIPQAIKDKVDLASRTVRLSLNHGIEQTEQGPMYLALFPPNSCDFSIMKLLLKPKMLALSR